MNNSNRFVIFCTARSGSYLLVDYLNKFSRIRCYGEIFKPNRLELSKAQIGRLKINNVAKRDSMPLKFMNQVYNLSANLTTGFKIFPTHNKKAIEYLIEDRRIKKILLIRNFIEVHLSLLMARKTNVWYNNKTEQKNTVKIDFDPMTFRKHHKILSGFYSKIEQSLINSNQNYYEITYNQVSEKNKIYDLVNFLIKKKTEYPNELKTNLKVQISKNYSEIVSNYDEMINYLKENHLKVFNNSKLAS